MVPAVEQEDCGGSAYIVPQYGNDAAVFYTEVYVGRSECRLESETKGRLFGKTMKKAM
jgi:hypothetical protein